MQSRGITVLPSDHWVDACDRITPQAWHSTQDNHNLAIMISQLLRIDPVITISALSIQTSHPRSGHGRAGLRPGRRDHGGSSISREDNQ
eukprot:5140506-Pyramimonas_sp.AAC.1